MPTGLTKNRNHCNNRTKATTATLLSTPQRLLSYIIRKEKERKKERSGKNKKVAFGSSVVG